MKFKAILLTAVFTLIFQINVLADYKKAERLTATDSLGNSVTMYVTGDEYVRVLHDEDGYVMTETDEGLFEYAYLSGGKIVPCGKEKKLKLADIPASYFEGERQQIYELMEQEGRYVPGSSPELLSAGVVKEFKGKGTVIVVPVAFSGGSDDFAGFTQTVENATRYFSEVSHGELLLDHLDVSEGMEIFVSSRTENYFHPKTTINPEGYWDETERMKRENELVSEAISYYGLGEKTTDKTIDVDGDGENDFLVFVYNTASESVWNSLLWPHQVRYNYEKYSIFGMGVMDWIFMPRSGGDKTLCHEMYHAIGAPDLYGYQNKYDYVGMWDIMDTGNGTMLAYMKYKYGGWIDEIPEITTAGTYTLKPASETENNCYKIPINDYEYYVLEYRSRFTGSINYLDLWRQWHNEGLLITKVDSRCSNGNMDTSEGIEVALVMHPALGANSVLGTVLPEFSPKSGHDRTLASGETDTKTVIKNVRENGDGTISFDVSFDGVSQREYKPLSDVEIKATLVHNESNRLCCELTVNSVTTDSGGNKTYTPIDEGYGMQYIYLDRKETSANSREYTDYDGPFPVDDTGLLWAYITDNDGVRMGKPYCITIHRSVPGINTAFGIREWEYDTNEMFSREGNRMVKLSFLDGEKYIGKLNMDKLVKFNVDGVEYEFLSEDIRGKTLRPDSEVLTVTAQDGSEVYMNGMEFDNFADNNRVMLSSDNGRASLFEPAETVKPGDRLYLDILSEGEIRYTTDNTLPTASSPLYDDGIVASEDMKITAGVFADEELLSCEEYQVYVQKDYRKYSCNDLNRIFKYSQSAILGGDGRFVKIAYTKGNGKLVLRTADWIELAKVENPDRSGVIYLEADRDIFVQEAQGDNITLSVVDRKKGVDLTVLSGDTTCVAVHSFDENADASLVVAGYDGGRMTTAETKTVSATKGKTEIVETSIDADKIRAFAFESLWDMEPLGPYGEN